MVLWGEPLNVSFRRSLVGNNLRAWQQIVASVMHIQLTEQRDTFTWSLQQHERFSVRSMYTTYVVPNVVQHNHVIWKLKVPLKIKIFMWYLLKGVVLTKYNLAKRQWRGSTKCCFCNVDENIQYLFFIVIQLNFCGELYKFRLILIHREVLNIFLDPGFKGQKRN